LVREYRRAIEAPARRLAPLGSDVDWNLQDGVTMLPESTPPKATMPNPPNWSNPPKRTLPAKPRRVRAGIKLATEATGEKSWAAQRWVRLLELAAEGPKLVEGMEYAKLGQTKSLEVQRGGIEAIVQGRQYRPYTSTLRVSPFDHDPWQNVIETMADQAVYAAKLLAGELPANIEDVFVPLGLKLFPTEPAEVVTSCTCGEGAWCKHVCCAAALFAEKLASDPFLMFTLRGLESDDLLERLRQRRATTTAAAQHGTVPVYVARIPGVSDVAAPPLEECMDRFWEIGPELAEVDFPIEAPQVTHPLLRRLGPSPFPAESAKFPLVGLLATCYEIVRDAALKETNPDPPAPLADEITPLAPGSESSATPGE